MKKLVIELNKKSIQSAIKYVETLKKNLPLMIEEFYDRVADWLIDRANRYLDSSDIGSNIKEEIKKGWKKEPSKSGIKIVNTNNHAVFVEFGVGKVGEYQPHPNASTEGYEYNVDSYYKDRKGYGYWLFKSKMEDLDIPQDRAEFIKDKGDYVVITRGTKGVWYAFNAIVEAQTELQKANGGTIGKIWEEVKQRWIK